MPKESENTEQFMSEINALRRQVAELKGNQHRCQQAEAALMACEKRNRLLGDSAPLGIFTTDSQGTLTGNTRKMLELHHWPLAENPESITQADFISMVSQKIFADIQRCIDRKMIITIEHSHTGTRAGVTHLRYGLSPITESDGSVSGVMGMAEDCTALKKTVGHSGKARQDIANCFNPHQSLYSKGMFRDLRHIWNNCPYQEFLTSENT